MTSNMGGPQSQNQEVSTTAVVGVVAIVFIVFGTLAGLTIAGRSVDAILYLVPLIIAPTILAFLTAKKSDRNKEILSDVQSKVNGRTDRLMNNVTKLEAQLISEGLIPVTHVDHLPEGGKHSG